MGEDLKADSPKGKSYWGAKKAMENSKEARGWNQKWQNEKRVNKWEKGMSFEVWGRSRARAMGAGAERERAARARIGPMPAGPS